MRILVVMRFRCLAGVAVAGVVFALAGCGGGSDEQAESVEPVATSGAATSIATTSATASVGTAAPASTVVEDLAPASTTTGLVSTSVVPVVEEAVTTTVAETTVVVESVVVVAEGPRVPAVTLELDDGTFFVSTEATRPVLYLFWAEW